MSDNSSAYLMPSINLLAFVEYATGISAAGRLVPDAWQDFPPTPPTLDEQLAAVPAEVAAANARINKPRKPRITRARKPITTGALKHAARVRK